MHSSIRSSDNLRLRLNVVLETESGEPVAELDDEAFLPGLFCENGLNTAEQAFRAFFESKVISPIRGMVRAQIQKREAEHPFYRLDGANHETPAIWLHDAEIADALDDKLLATLNQRSVP